LGEIFLELGDRPLSGSGRELIAGARQARWLMENRPEISFRCGPLALRSICRVLSPPAKVDEIVYGSASTQRGFSLLQLQKLSEDLQLNFQMAKRQAGAPVILPCLVHWGVGHYAAVLKQSEGRFLVMDPTFGRNRWMSQRALDYEASGYFLIPPGPLTNGWETVDATEGQNIWGKGVTSGSDPNDTAPYDQMADPNCDSAGMATCNAHLMLVSAHIEDTPISFTPPRGPPIRLTVTYNQREANQPANFRYSNFGQNWTFNWLSYLTDNSTNTAADVDFYVPGGGTEIFSYDTTNSVFETQWRNQATLLRLSGSSYRMNFPDGSANIFSQSDGTVGSSRKVFLTQVIDPTGYTNLLNYDPSLRLVSVTDPQAGLTNLTFFYDGSQFSPASNVVQQVTDRYGRSATFNYGSSLNQLQSITDVLGLTSQVAYADYTVSQLQTPYGTTTFNSGEDGQMRWLEITDPQGNTSRVEYNESEFLGIPNSDPGTLVPTNIYALYTRNYILYGRNTFYWDKKALAEAPGDYSKARLYHWLHSPDGASAVGVLESVKEPLENRVWFNYPGQTAGSQGASFQPDLSGAVNLPSLIGRVLDDGSTQLYEFDRNSLGQITNAVDPVGRRFAFDYATNQIDLLRVRQTGGTNNELLAAFSYNSQHLPLAATNAAGQVTRFAYNTYGQITYLTNALAQVTSFAYDGAGRLLSIVGPTVNGLAPTTSFGYDAYDRVQAVTNAHGYWVTVNYDAFDRPTTNTFPDGTFESITYRYLDPQLFKDRAGNITQFVYDSLRHLTQTTQSTNWITYFDWCDCGGLGSITDPLGRITQWFHDLQGRVTSKQYPDGSAIQYTYEKTTSRVAALTNERGQTRNFYYYADDDLLGVLYANTNITPTVLFHYDPYYNRLTSIVDGTGLNSYAYYPITATPVLGAGQLQSITRPLGIGALLYSYDALGRVASESIARFGSLVYSNAYGYDAIGRVSSAVGDGNIVTYSYDGTSSRLTNVTHPFQLSSAYTYYNAQGDFCLKSITNWDVTGDTFFQFQHIFNPLDQITNWIKQLGSSWSTSALSYDAIGELTNASATGSSPATNQYSYDLAGNRAAEKLGTNLARAWFNPMNQLIGKDPGTSTARSYQWDEENRLVGITEGTWHTALIYNGLGQLTELNQTNGGSYQYFRWLLWSGTTLRQELVQVAGWSTYALLNYDEMYENYNSGTFGPVYLTRDHLGSVREAVGPGGGSYQEYSYDLFGRQTVLSNISGIIPLNANIGFAGMYMIPVHKLLYGLNRVYDPDLGRWLSRDPAGEGADLNLYRYAGNDPVNNVDPDGLCAQRGFIGGPGQFWDQNSGEIRDSEGKPIRDQLNPLNPINFSGGNSPLRSAAEDALYAGRAGGFGELDTLRLVGDELTPHHMPQAALNFTRRDAGGAIMLPTTEHVQTRNYFSRGAQLAIEEAEVPFRSVLAWDVRDLRRIAGSKYNQGIKDLLQYYRQNFPQLIEKPPTP
jgi:RHS repeat-associated protein